VNQWDLELAQLVDGLHRDGDGVTEVPLPTALSTTRLLQLRSGPQHLAADLARPMPRQPSPAARIGSRFHTWVETHAGQQRLLEVDEIPGAADVGIAGDAELRMLTDAFRAGPYGDRRPHRVEAPFSLVLAGQVVRGRIDAVYRTEGGWEVLDWKTSHRTSADPLQLAVYRLAWAELAGVPLESVAAAFYYVRTGVVDRPAHLPGRLELEGMLAGV
jgi:DNA helicase-2/ATP-dependent DNA helicase PcrA